MQHPDDATAAYSHYNGALTHRIKDALQSRDALRYFRAVSDFHPHNPSDIEDPELYREGLMLSASLEHPDDGVKPLTDLSVGRIDYNALARAVIPSWQGYISKRDLVRRVSAIKRAGIKVDPPFRKMRSRRLFMYFNELRSKLSTEARQNCSPGVLEDIAQRESIFNDPFFVD